MRKLFVWGFLVVFGWQLLGYTIYFEWKHFLVKKEIKKLLKRGVPSGELIDFHFSSEEIRELTWLKENEFEWNGHLFDVVQSFTGCDQITHLRCISDTQEKALFKDLNKYVAVNLDGDNQNVTILKIAKIVYLDFVHLPELQLVTSSKVNSKDFFFDSFEIFKFSSQPLTPPPNLNCSSYVC